MTIRALVLGGGGPVGIAWESGLIAGLEEAGVALGQADRIVGTSAGSVVGAQLALGASGADLLAAQRSQLTRPATRSDGERAKSAKAAAAPAPDLGPLMRLFAERPNGDAAADLAWRQRLGQFALAAQTITAEAFIAGFGRVATAEWPTRDYRCTAIDAITGEFRAWSRDDGVPLGTAVASSCAVPGIYPCIPIGGARYYDGGLRSATNADLALGADRVVVISVMPPDALGPVGAGNPLLAEIEQLRAAGANVSLLAADEASRAAFGPNLMDARKRGDALEAGLTQGRAAAAELRAHW